MLVGTRMTFPVITVSPDMPINETLNMMRRERIRRVPVVKDGKLVGIVSDKDLLNASPSPVTSLSVWEMNYLLSKVTVKDVMTKAVLTITEDTPIEEAARIMADNKIGGLPVIRGEQVVGIITETDLFKVFLELMGARKSGVRATILLTEKPGELAKVTKAIADQGGNFLSFGTFIGKDPTNQLITFKVEGMNEDQVRQCLTPIVENVLDIRKV
jgi:acetoin utilization protein AcuB